MRADLAAPLIHQRLEWGYAFRLAGNRPVDHIGRNDAEFVVNPFVGQHLGGNRIDRGAVAIEGLAPVELLFGIDDDAKQGRLTRGQPGWGMAAVAPHRDAPSSTGAAVRSISDLSESRQSSMRR